MDEVAHVRSHPRFNVLWPMLYLGKDFVGEGTMVDLSLQGGRFAGTMPVVVGMRLSIHIDSPHKSADLIIEDAVVTWVSEEQFGTQILRMRTEDMEWLQGYLEVAERRHSFRQVMGLTSDASNVAEAPLALPLKG